MLRSLIAGFVVAGAAGSLFAGEPAVPPYGYTLSSEACKKYSEEMPLWDFFDEKSWEKIDREDKAGIVDEYCKHGSELFEKHRYAMGRMQRALKEGATLSDVKDADSATEKSIDFVCDHKIEGRSACKHCCRQLVTAHGRLIEKEGELSSTRLKEKGEKLQDEGMLRDARRLQSAGITNEQFFENTGERKQGATRRTAPEGSKAAVDEDAIKGGGLRDKPAVRERKAEPKKAPPIPGMTAKEAAYVAEAGDSWVPGLGTIKGNLAKGEVEDMHAYVRNCYQDNPNSQWCYCKKMTTKEIQERSTGDCQSELLKRKLGQ